MVHTKPLYSNAKLIAGTRIVHLYILTGKIHLVYTQLALNYEICTVGVSTDCLRFVSHS